MHAFSVLVVWVAPRALDRSTPHLLRTAHGLHRTSHPWVRKAGPLLCVQKAIAEGTLELTGHHPQGVPPAPQRMPGPCCHFSVQSQGRALLLCLEVRAVAPRSPHAASAAWLAALPQHMPFHAGAPAVLLSQGSIPDILVILRAAGWQHSPGSVAVACAQLAWAHRNTKPASPWAGAI